MAFEGRGRRVLPKECVFFVLLFFVVPLCNCQSSTPQNLETFYPYPDPSPSPPQAGNVVPPPTSISPVHSPVKHNNKKLVIKVVAATAATTLVLSALFFFVIQRCLKGRRQGSSRSDEFSVRRYSQSCSGISDRFARLSSRVKGLIIDENGLDVVYWKGVAEGRPATGDMLLRNEKGNGVVENDRVGKAPSFSKRNTESVQEVPLLRGKSSTSHVDGVDQERDSKTADSFSDRINASTFNFNHVQNRSQSPLPLVAAPAIRPPLPLQRIATLSNAKAPEPPPPVLATHAVAGKSTPPPPPPAPVQKRRHVTPPAPPLKPGGPAASVNHNAERKGKHLANGGGVRPEDTDRKEEGNGGQVKLKPLHWDKINKNTDQSMVWDKLDSGSFRVDNGLMEALFGYVAANRKSPRSEENRSETKSSSSPPQIMILEPRKSQNTAIVIKSLSATRKEILDCLRDGHGLEIEVLEKLVRIAPTQEEETQIMEFEGDPTKLADADSFFYNLLQASPSAFSRIKAMYFRSNYAAEVEQFKECLEILERACKELRSRGLFMKMLEAVLKAGNKMNAGTSRGNAQAFKLSSLKKLSDVKSTDGKTTLLHFVVEEVVRFEGKKLVLMRNRNLSKSGSRSDTGETMPENPSPRGGRDREYKMIGLPVVGGLSAEFLNVKNAAKIDINALSGTLPALETGLKGTKRMLLRSADSGAGEGFEKEMRGFLDGAEEELPSLKEEGERVMDMVKRTGEYYQQGDSNVSKSDQLQLFVIVTDFLGMVDKVCVDISRKLQQAKMTTGSKNSKSSPSTKPTARFPNLPPHFLDEKSNSSSSESD